MFSWLSTMPPVTNRYSHRYHPFSRPIALHTLFPMERPTCLSHSLYTIHPIDCDVTSVDPPQPLLPKTATVLAASAYFIMQERLHPNKIYEKPKGEVGRTDPRIGYSLVAALKWPTEVYKEVQVGYPSHSQVFSAQSWSDQIAPARQRKVTHCFIRKSDTRQFGCLLSECTWLFLFNV